MTAPPRPGARRRPAGTPTRLNLDVLVATFGLVDRVADGIAVTDLPHLRRCVAAGLVAVGPRGILTLTPAGRSARDAHLAASPHLLRPANDLRPNPDAPEAPHDVRGFIRDVDRIIRKMGLGYRHHELAAREDRILRAALEHDLEPCGSGKDRLCYRGERHVVKVARHAIGLDANISESKRWAKAPSAYRPWLLPVRSHSLEGTWLVMDPADDDSVDDDWLRRFYLWVESREDGDRSDMPPRSLLREVEHAYDASDWKSLRGHPVLYDYAT